MSRVAVSSVAPVVRAPSNVWPGMSAAVGQEFSRIGQGLPVSRPNLFQQKHERYYHCVDYATGGHQQLTFFTAQQQDHITNLPAGEVPTERPMWLTGICITFQDLTALSSGSPSVARSGAQMSASAITSIARAEEVRSILQAGLLKLTVADRVVHESQDLTHYPSDGGFYVHSGFVGFASATNASIAPYSNGEPIAGNRFRFPQPYAILPGKKLRVDLFWQTALSISTAGRIKVELVGESVWSLNN